MDNEQAQQLLNRYRSGECTEEEAALVETWFLEWPDEGTLPLATQVEAADARVWRKLDAHMSRRILWRWTSVAAAVLLLLAGAWFYWKPSADPAQVADIMPGGKGATLTLADGQQIQLSGTKAGTLAHQAGVIITKTNEGDLQYIIKDDNAGGGQYNRLTTGTGQTFRIRLPDETDVWLNAASSIKYPVSFKGRTERVIELSGEAYFVVRKDAKQPFIVKHQQQTVRVLGTDFNIQAYPAEPVRTTLVEGLVSVTSGEQVKVLQPGQQAISGTSGFQIITADIPEAVAWKNGEFRFADATIGNIMKTLTRWYDIEVSYEGKPTTALFSAAISRDASIRQVLRILERTKAVQFKIEGKKVIVTQ